MYEHGGDIYNNIGCLDFSANINFLGMPGEVRSAVIDSIDGCIHYPDVNMRKLKDALSCRENIASEHIICGNGAAELIFSVAAAYRRGKALLVAPGFYEYEQALSFNDCNIDFFHLKKENGFSLQECGREFLDSIDSSFDMVFLCNPNNPTGELLTADFLQEALGVCERNDVFLAVDECFIDFVENKEKYSVAPLVENHPGLLVLKAFTKMYAIPGLRLGYALCSNERLIETMRKGLQPWNVSVPAQAAGIAAASLSGFEERTRRLLREERAFLEDGLKSAGICIYGDAANFIFFEADEDFAVKMKEKNILVRDCSNYVGLSRGFFRIAVRSHEENTVFLKALNEIFRSDSEEKGDV